MFKNYFKTALRNLWRAKVFSLINISGLSVGLACCMLIFLYNIDEVSYDRFHDRRDNIYRITATISRADGNVDKIGSTGMMPGPAFKQAAPEIEDFVRIQSGGFNIKHNKEIFEQETLFVDSNFFSVFSFPLIAGDPKTVGFQAVKAALANPVKNLRTG